MNVLSVPQSLSERRRGSMNDSVYFGPFGGCNLCHQCQKRLDVFKFISAEVCLLCSAPSDWAGLFGPGLWFMWHLMARTHPPVVRSGSQWGAKVPFPCVLTRTSHSLAPRRNSFRVNLQHKSFFVTQGAVICPLRQLWRHLVPHRALCSLLP